jgi:hypothetical protein
MMKWTRTSRLSIKISLSLALFLMYKTWLWCLALMNMMKRRLARRAVCSYSSSSRSSSSSDNLCGMDPLVAVPHTTLCMGVDSFTEENRSPLHVRADISL